MSATRTRNALILYGISTGNSMKATRDLFSYIGYHNSLRNYLKYDGPLDLVDLVVFPNLNKDVSLDVDKFGEIISKCIEKNIGIVALGDGNKIVLDYLNYETEMVENHDLEGEAHSIVTTDGEIFYIPSNHSTIPIIENYTPLYLNDPNEKMSGGFMRVIAASPNRCKSAKEKKLPELEIIASPDIKYVGIMGAPEEFFSSMPISKAKAATDTLSLLNQLIYKVILQ